MRFVFKRKQIVAFVSKEYFKSSCVWGRLSPQHKGRRDITRRGTRSGPVACHLGPHDVC